VIYVRSCSRGEERINTRTIRNHHVGHPRILSYLDQVTSPENHVYCTNVTAINTHSNTVKHALPLPFLHNLPNTLRKDPTPFLHILLAHIQRRDKPNNLINTRRQNQHPFLDTLPRHPRRHIFRMLAVVVFICAVRRMVRRRGGRWERCRRVGGECVRGGGGRGEFDADHKPASAHVDDVGVEGGIVFECVESGKEFDGPGLDIVQYIGFYHDFVNGNSSCA
jgi:hypothetical protein